MHPIFHKTLGGLSAPYYIRQFLFGLIFPALMITVLNRSESGIAIGMWLLLIINTLLYPYARFVYESVINYIQGGHLFIVNALFMLAIKCITMLLCWLFALLIAPIGLAYLYHHHTKAEKQSL